MYLISIQESSFEFFSDKVPSYRCFSSPTHFQLLALVFWTTFLNQLFGVKNDLAFVLQRSKKTMKQTAELLQIQLSKYVEFPEKQKAGQRGIHSWPPPQKMAKFDFTKVLQRQPCEIDMVRIRDVVGCEFFQEQFSGFRNQHNIFEYSQIALFVQQRSVLQIQFLF